MKRLFALLLILVLAFSMYAGAAPPPVPAEVNEGLSALLMPPEVWEIR